MALHSHLLLDRHVDHVAPLGPRTVVVAHVLEPQEVLQREPAVAAALADAAIGDRRLRWRQLFFVAIDLLELGSGLEGPVLGIDGPRPRDAACTRDMSAAQRAFV